MEDRLSKHENSIGKKVKIKKTGTYGKIIRTYKSGDRRLLTRNLPGIRLSVARKRKSPRIRILYDPEVCNFVIN